MTLITTKELATALSSRLHVCPATVRRWVLEGKLPYVGGARSKRFDLDAVMAALTYTPTEREKNDGTGR